MKQESHVPLTIILAAFFSLFNLMAWSQEVTVYTDKADYLPGDTVLILGDGWQPGEQVKLEIDHSTITHGNTSLYTIADVNGALQIKQYVIESYHLGEKFSLTATGLASGLIALTTFSDGAYTWTGSVNSDWHTAGNWMPPTGAPPVPTASDDVFIPAGASVVISAPAYCKSITFQPNSSKLMSYLAANGGLTVLGKLSIGKAGLAWPTSATISGSVSCESFATESSYANYSLIVDGVLNVSSVVQLTMPLAIYGSPHTNTLQINGEVHVRGNVLSEGAYSYRTTEVVFGHNGSLFIDGDYITLKAHAKTNMYNGGKLYVRREWKGSEPNLEIGYSAGTVIYNGEDNQVVRGLNYNNLTLAGSGTKTISGVYVYGKLSLQGMALASACPTFMNTPVLEYKGSAPQITGLEFPNSLFFDVIIDNPYGVILNESKTIRTLTLVNGVVKTNGFELTVGRSATSSVYAGTVNGGSDSSYIEGKLSRVYANNGFFHFPIGKNGNYRPLAIRLIKTQSSACTISAEQFEAPLAITPPSNTSLYPERHWSVTQFGLNVNTFAYDISLDATGFSASGKPLVFKYDGSTVISQEAAVTDNVFTATNLSTFSSFAIGESSVATSIVAETPEAIHYGDQDVALTATVMRESGTTPVTSGTVEFFVDGKSVGVAQTIINGKASVNFDPSKLAAGSYVINVQYRGDGTLTGSSSDPDGNGVLVIQKAPATIVFEDLDQIYDGTSKVVRVLTLPEGVIGLTVKYYKRAGADRTEVAAQQVINAGSYDVEATLQNANYALPGGADKVAGTLLIRKATAILSFDAATLDPVYTGSALSATAIARWNTASVEGVSIQYIKDGASEPAPTNAGTYQAIALLANDNIDASPVTSDFVIRKAESNTSINVAGATYDGTPKGGTASVTGVGGLDKVLAIYYSGTTAAGLRYGSTEPPLDAGTYLATAAYGGDDNHMVSIGERAFIIVPAPAAIRLSDLEKMYNGQPQSAFIITEPEGLPVLVTYNGLPALPSMAGSYDILATVNNRNYEDVRVTGKLVINKADQTISWSNPSDITYGATLGSTQLNAQVTGISGGSPIGTVTYTPALGAVLGAGDAQPLTIDVAETENYKAATTTVYINVARATPELAVTVSSGAYNGTTFRAMAKGVGALGEDLSAEVKLSYEKKTGAATWEPILSAPMDAGDYRAIALYAATANYRAASDTKEFSIGKAETVTTITINGGPFTYTGTTINPATVTVTGPGGLNLTPPAGYAGNLNAGTATAIYSYEGDGNYKPSSDSKTFIIGKATPVVTAIGGSFMYDGAPKLGSGTASGVGLPAEALSDAVSLSFSGATDEGAAYGPTITAPTAAGRYTVTATCPETANYLERSATAELIIYAVPVVTLSTPGPLAVDNTATVTVGIQGVVQANRVWKYTNTVTGVTVSGQTDDRIEIKSSVPVVYAVSLEYKNAVGQTKVTPSTYAVFYDPTAGFVTGGGWIASPKVDELVYMKAEGRANFGFVSKYEKGKTYPTGNTEFQFQAGGMSFKSTAYEWLVISGARAQYKGLGTINGAGSYGFLLTAVDGDLAGTAGADLFRIKIWDKNNGDAVVYDNQYKADEGADPTTRLGGGSIVLHQSVAKKNITATVSEAHAAEEPGAVGLHVAVFPNPAPASFNIQIQSDAAPDKITVRIRDLFGRTVEVIPHAAPGQTYSIGAAYRPGIYFVEVLKGVQRRVVKVLKVSE